MADPTHASSPCALVVDHDAFIRIDALDILEDADFTALQAAHAAAALELLQKRQPDLSLLFTDGHMLGEMDSFALARHATERRPYIVISSGETRLGPGDRHGRAQHAHEKASRRLAAT